MVTTEPQELLRSVALRVTQPRVAVLREVDARPHSDADAITRAVRADLGSVSTQAIYDVLAALTGAGLVRRIEPAGHPARYETRTGDNHHHVVCRTCGAIDDIDCANEQAPCLTPTTSHGFAIDEAEVTYWGQCPECMSAAATTARLTPTKEK